MLLRAQTAITVAKYTPDIHLFFRPEGAMRRFLNPRLHRED